MSYQYTSNSGSHRLQEFVPTYVSKSDYLPTNRVVETNQNEANQWVQLLLSSFPPTKDRNARVTFTLKDQQSSTPIDMFQWRPMKMFLSINPSQRRNSTAESGDTDLRPHQLWSISLSKQLENLSFSSSSLNKLLTSLFFFSKYLVRKIECSTKRKSIRTTFLIDFDFNKKYDV